MPAWLPPLAVATGAVVLLNTALLLQRLRQRADWPGRLRHELRRWDGRLPDELGRRG